MSDISLTNCKIIKASAGTGKTYRLSLEFIILLLKTKDNNFDWYNILTITFTKKAAAEIKERIFSHLEHICVMDKEGILLIENIENITKIKLSENDKKYLCSVYKDMRINKDKLMISTIDFFINKIFSVIIVPFWGINNYEINDKINENYFEDLFSSFLRNKNFIFSFFEENETFYPEKYKNFIYSLIEKRWQFFLSNYSQNKDTKEILKLRKKLIDNTIKELILKIKDNIKIKNDIDFEHLLLSKFYVSAKYFFNSELENIFDVLLELFEKDDFLEKENKIILGLDYFWKKTSINKHAQNELEEIWNKYKSQLADYLLYKLIIPEQNSIYKMLSSFYEKYDEIKIRDKIFTFSDIAYYTLKFLHSPEISMIDNLAVTNRFYEFLSKKINFLLIDEFQDTSIIQWKIFSPIINEMLSGFSVNENKGVIVVGDEKQSIYRWRGGNRELFLNLNDIFPYSKEETLNVSYRSYPIIINFINNLFASELTKNFFKENNLNWKYEKINCHKKNKEGFISVSIKNLYHKNGVKSSKDEEIYLYAKNVIIPLIKSQKIDVQNTVVLARNNKELEAFTQALNEGKINYKKDSSNHLFVHKAIKPFIWILRFVLNCSTIDCIKLLRSDIFRIFPQELMKINFEPLIENNDWDLFFKTNSENSFVNILNEIYYFPRNSIDEWIFNVAKTFNWINYFDNESSAINFNKFLELANNFYINNNFENSLSGFLRFCEKSIENEDIPQVNVDEDNALTLLTVHKSKGLEFDTVILLWDCRTLYGNFIKDFSSYVVYNNDFSKIEDWVFTYKYSHILKKSKWENLLEEEKNKNMIEEINIIYVALTRPAKNLFIQAFYNKVKNKKGLGIEEYLEVIKQDNVSNWFINILYNFVKQNKNNDSASFFDDYGLNGSDVLFYAKKGVINVFKKEKIKKIAVNNYFKYPNKFNYKLDNNNNYDNKQKKIRGIIAHYYLSFIVRNNLDEHNFAKIRVFQEYGSMLPQGELEILIDRTVDFINNNLEYFGNSWDIVFNEFQIYEKNKEFRIDRLMINISKKIIMIIDYKTSRNFEESQIENYKYLIIKNLPSEYKNFIIKTKYLTFNK